MNRSPASSAETLLTYMGALGVQLDTAFLRDALRLMAHLLMEVEVSAIIEAGHYERNGSRRAYRNGYRQRTWETAIGQIRLSIPKLRAGTYYPGFIHALPDAERVLLSLVWDALLGDLSLSRIESALREIGVEPAHPSQLADISEQLDDLIAAFRSRPLVDAYPTLMIDVLRFDQRLAVAVALGLNDTGQREVLGFEATRGYEDHLFWSDFLGSLIERGLEGVEIVSAGADSGLRSALRQVLPDAALQPRASASAPELVNAVSNRSVDTHLPANNRFSTPRAALNMGALTMPYEAVQPELLLSITDAELLRLVGGFLLLFSPVAETAGDCRT